MKVQNYGIIIICFKNNLDNISINMFVFSVLITEPEIDASILSIISKLS